MAVVNVFVPRKAKRLKLTDSTDRKNIMSMVASATADAPAYVNGVSEDLFSMGLCLPSGPWVSDEDVERVAREIIACCK